MKKRLLERLAAVKELKTAAALYKKRKGCVLSGLDGTVKALYPTNLPRVQADSRNLEIQAGRAAALRLVAGEEPGIVFVTAEALLQKLPRPSGVTENSLEFSVGATLEQGRFIEMLAAMGYERADEVDTIGQFSVRGGIIDVFPLNSQNPARIEWFDADIDGIRFYDITNKRSLTNTETLRIVPLQMQAAEDVFDAYLRDYGATDTLFVMDEPAQLKETLEHLYKEGQSYKEELWPPAEIWAMEEKQPAVTVSALDTNYFTEFRHMQVPVRRVTSYNRSIERLIEDLQSLLAEGIQPYIMMSTVLKARGITESLRQRGFRFWNENWLLLTENDIYGLQRRRRFKSKHKGAKLQYFTDIKGGDYVVHDVHGIGRYIGVETMLVDGMHRDYLLLQYAGSDRLYVPVDQVSLLHKYVGSEGITPKLSKMGGADWKRMKTKASTAITQLAEELIRLYALRKITNGYAYADEGHCRN